MPGAQGYHAGGGDDSNPFRNDPCAEWLRLIRRRGTVIVACDRQGRHSLADIERPDCIAHWSEIEEPDTSHYRGDDELLAIGAPLGRHFGLSRIGIHHERLLPGRRTSYPHAESAEEEFVYVLSGTPDVWLDGTLHRLKPGDAVGFPPGTGICHTFINNSDEEATLLVIGETARPENRIYYARNPEQRERRTDWWEDRPERPEGDHDGLSDLRRAELRRADGER